MKLGQALPLAGAFLVLGWASAAQESPTAKVCMDKAMTQADMHECAAKDLQAANTELNATYQQVLVKLKGNANAIAKVRSMERTWVAYRSAFIEARFPAADKAAEYGSAYPTEADLILAKVTRRQTDALRDFLTDENSNP